MLVNKNHTEPSNEELGITPTAGHTWLGIFLGFAAMVLVYGGIYLIFS